MSTDLAQLKVATPRTKQERRLKIGTFNSPSNETLYAECAWQMHRWDQEHAHAATYVHACNYFGFSSSEFVILYSLFHIHVCTVLPIIL